MKCLEWGKHIHWHIICRLLNLNFELYLHLVQYKYFQNGKETESEEPSQEMKMLTEMFPSACSLEITHCLCLSNGDMEKAAQLILHRLETGDCIKSSPRQVFTIHF